MNVNIPFFIKVNTDFLVGVIVNDEGAANVQKNAALVVLVGNAIVKSNGTDVTSVLATIDAALGSVTTDPAKAAVIQTVIAWIGTKAAALQGLASGSITASGIAALLVAAAQEAVTVAQKYLPAAAKSG